MRIDFSADAYLFCKRRNAMSRDIVFYALFVQ